MGSLSSLYSTQSVPMSCGACTLRGLYRTLIFHVICTVLPESIFYPTWSILYAFHPLPSSHSAVYPFAGPYTAEFDTCLNLLRWSVVTVLYAVKHSTTSARGYFVLCSPILYDTLRDWSHVLRSSPSLVHALRVRNVRHGAWTSTLEIPHSGSSYSTQGPPSATLSSTQSTFFIHSIFCSTVPYYTALPSTQFHSPCTP